MPEGTGPVGQVWRENPSSCVSHGFCMSVSSCLRTWTDAVLLAVLLLCAALSSSGRPFLCPPLSVRRRRTWTRVHCRRRRSSWEVPTPFPSESVDGAAFSVASQYVLRSDGRALGAWLLVVVVDEKLERVTAQSRLTQPPTCPQVFFKKYVLLTTVSFSPLHRHAGKPKEAKMKPKCCS